MTISKINTLNYINNKYQNYLVAGIDLGTTNSLIATVQYGKVKILSDDQGRYLLPSIVYYQKNLKIVGWKAQKKMIMHPTNSISSIKRLIGLSLKDIQKKYPNLPYKFKSSKNNIPLIITDNGSVNAVEVSAEILKILSTRAELALKRQLNGVVITVPAYFNNAQRQSTKDAAYLAGLNLLRLLNEPTAAAIAYGLNAGKEKIIAVYDLGGGTFDISLLHLNKGIFQVLATGGDISLGGDDFDYLLAKWLSNCMNLTDNNNYYIQRKLLNIANSTKIALSNVENVNIKIFDWHGEISRNQFEKIIMKLVKRTLLICYRAIKDAGIHIKEIQEVIMVGGSSRIPLVRKKVGEFFSLHPLININPDTIVATGAAIQADILIGNKPKNDILLLDVTPLSLGLETIGGLVEKIISRNTTIPVIRTKEFTTFKDNQNSMMIHILQGESELMDNCSSLGRFVLYGFPKLPAGKIRISITFQVDTNGILNVTALEKFSGIKNSIKIKPSYDISNK
ncbi:Chaperone protein HscA [Serratia symbiotica]|nr:Chaperone protein HscA [Serratia symbiotica]